jgi:hypothetical protein
MSAAACEAEISGGPACAGNTGRAGPAPNSARRREGPIARAVRPSRPSTARADPAITRGPPPGRRPFPDHSARRKPIIVASPPAIRAIPAAVIQFVTGEVTNGTLSAKRIRSDVNRRDRAASSTVDTISP